LLNIVDLILTAFLFLFALRGLFRGLFRESFSLVGLFLGFVVAIRYDEFLATLWKGYWKISPTILRAICFVVLFFVVYFLSNLVGLLLHNSARLLFLQTINRVGGIAIGLGKGAVLLSLVLFFVSLSSWMPEKMRKNMDGSYLVPPLRWLGVKLVQVARPDFLKREEAGPVRRAASPFFPR
jgi:membrane protein required for colicin V production